MEIEFADLNGNIHIGVTIYNTEKFALVPIEAPKSLINLISNTLDVEVIKVPERIIGTLITGNSNGLVISNILSQEVMEQIETTGLPIYQAPEFFALSNVALINDHGGLISPIIPQAIREKIQSILKVPLTTRTLGNSDLVGSLGFVTNYGGLLTPQANEEETCWDSR